MNNLNINTNNTSYFFNNKNCNYCINCNKKGHYIRTCKLPRISNGIIGIYVNNNDLTNNNDFINFISNNIYNDKYDNIVDTNDNINFLLIQRRNSLQYVNFIRGKYDINIDSVIKLLESITEYELDLIKTYDFDYLWNNLWKDNVIYIINEYEIISQKEECQIDYKKEYVQPKIKFNKIKENYNIIDNINIKYQFNEWGFPKGRREPYESNIVCAIREFQEETLIHYKNFNVINKNNIIESTTGTDGLDYISNYYIGIFKNNNLNNKLSFEVGAVNFFTLDKALNILRPYHIQKKKILIRIHNIINDFLLNHSI